MATTDADVLRVALDWLRKGHQVILATVLRTWGSAPRKAGAHMIIRDDGIFEGSISGGCVEGAVIQEAQSGVEGVGRELSFGVSTEEAWEVGLSCGGEIRIWLEPVAEDVIAPLLERILQRRRAVLQFFLDGSQKMMVLEHVEFEGTPTSIVHNGDRGIRIYWPSRRIFVIGAVHIAQVFSVMAEQVGYEVVIIDPREIFIDKRRWGSSHRRISLYPDECLAAENIDCHDALIALSHDPKIDDQALKIALDAEAFYIGALGSRKNHARRCQRLQLLGCSTAQVARISGPVGLNIGSKTPAEIAVSILAELISHQGNR